MLSLKVALLKKEIGSMPLRDEMWNDDNNPMGKKNQSSDIFEEHGKVLVAMILSHWMPAIKIRGYDSNFTSNKKGSCQLCLNDTVVLLEEN